MTCTSSPASLPHMRYTYVSIRQHTSAYVSIRQHTAAYGSIRQHTSAYVSIPARGENHNMRDRCHEEQVVVEGVLEVLDDALRFR